MTGLYVHLPFCLRKCPYCAFFSRSDAKEKMLPYTKRLIKEAQTYLPQKVDTIYFGGGTPTCVPTDMLLSVLDALKAQFPCNGEITIEANPATVDKESLARLRNGGFNRISIGVQSFDDTELNFLGRLHTAKDAVNAIQDANDAGFTNISADIMFGLPMQKPEDVIKSVSILLTLPVTHISAYSLSVEEGTTFAAAKVRLPEEDMERRMYWQIADTLTESGFIHYEISSFARPGLESMHNTNYWLCGNYIGLGAGAHSYYGNVRYENIADIDMYIACENPVREKYSISEKEHLEEYYMLGLRRLCGVRDLGNPHADVLIEQGLLVRENHMLHLTRRGIDIANYVITELCM